MNGCSYRMNMMNILIFLLCFGDILGGAEGPRKLGLQLSYFTSPEYSFLQKIYFIFYGVDSLEGGGLKYLFCSTGPSLIPGIKQ